ncbi:hypothetical protein G6F56_009520 [Rhizopus delemar]|nr:hypothetical protein G6F56_009520 [Rhizopus delemar]
MSFVNYNAANFSNPAGIRRQRPVETEGSLAVVAQEPVLTENVTIISDDSDDNIDVISLCESEEMYTDHSYTSSVEMVITDIDEDDLVSDDLYSVENESNTEITTVMEVQTDQIQETIQSSYDQNDDEVEISPENDVIIEQVEEFDSFAYWSRLIRNRVMPAHSFFTQFANDDMCNKFFFETGIYYDEDWEFLCQDSSGSIMKIVKNLNGVPKAWKCAGILDMETGQRCCNGKTLSIRYGSFFYNRKLPYQMVQEDLQQQDCQIGEYDNSVSLIVVKIDESKFGKNKNHRGHLVRGAWVVGGVERTPERKCFLVVVNDRNTATMDHLLLRYVKAGSLVYTDCWRAYNNMSNLGMDYEHQTVNHSVTFRDGDVCTNTIEDQEQRRCFLGY